MVKPSLQRYVLLFFKRIDFEFIVVEPQLYIFMKVSFKKARHAFVRFHQKKSTCVLVGNVKIKDAKKKIKVTCEISFETPQGRCLS